MAVPLVHLRHVRAPYAIELSTEMVPRLLAAVTAGEAMGCEIGGLLIGSFPKAPTLTLRVEDFVLLERRENDERQFTLSIEQRARLSTMRHNLLQQQRRVLGLFRSHLRKEKLVLSDADRELTAGEFGRAIHVTLLMQTEAPHTGAFFLPDAEGAMQAGPSLPEFQFRAEEIARLAPRSTSLVSEPATGRPLLVLRATVAWAAVVLLLCLGLTVWAPLTMRAFFARGGLRLSVEPHGSMLELRWNRHQPDLSSSTSAILTIQDGGVERRLVLAPAQIREGRIAYRPAGDRVTFRLNVPLPDSAELVQVVAASLPEHK
jgi:hypothetical protein